MNWISILNLTSELMDYCSLQRSHSKWGNTGNRHSALQQEMESIAHGNLRVALRTTTKTTTNKTKMTENYCGGITDGHMCTKFQCCSAWRTKQNHGPVWPAPVLNIRTCWLINHLIIQFISSVIVFHYLISILLFSIQLILSSQPKRLLSEINVCMKNLVYEMIKTFDNKQPAPWYLFIKFSIIFLGLNLGSVFSYISV